MTIQRKPLRRLVSEPVQTLLVNRQRAAAMLGGISTATLIRMEQAGRLKPIRLSGHATSVVFYRIEDIQKLAQGEPAEVGGPRHV